MGQVKNFMIDVAGIVGLDPNEPRAERLFRKIMPDMAASVKAFAG